MKGKQQIKHQLKVDDILYSSWGYDQTNIDFYQVIAVKPKSVILREIESEMPKGEEGFMTGYVSAVKDKFIEHSEPMLRRVGKGYNDSVSVIVSSCANAWPWDGKPKRCSWYG